MCSFVLHATQFRYRLEGHVTRNNPRDGQRRVDVEGETGASALAVIVFPIGAL
jgi:hypothetical protein